MHRMVGKSHQLVISISIFMPSKLIDTIECFYKYNINFNIYFFNYKPLSGVVKDSFQVRSSLHSPSSVSRVHSIFSSGGSLLGSGRQWRAIAVACIVLGVSWIPLTSSSRGDAWYWGFSLIVSGFYHPKWHNFIETVCLSFFLSVCTYTLTFTTCNFRWI